MMRFSRSLVLMLLPLAPLPGLPGCAAPSPKATVAPMVMPATPDQAVDLQNQFMKLKPNARVGHVSAVNATVATAAIGGIPVGEVHVGDSVQFVDTKFQTFANGTVTSADMSHPDFPFLIVDYKPNPSGRAPVNGDLVVYLPGQ